MQTPYKIALVVVLLAGLVWGGKAINHKLECDGLEEDYLNAFSSMNRASAIAGISGNDKGLGGASSRLKELANKEMEAATQRIFVTCGERATNTALRKAGETVGF